MAFGGKFDDRDDVASDINVTPMVDVMLVLLVIFILTVPVLTHSVGVELPQTQAVRTQTETKAVSLTVAQDGMVYWDGQAIGEAALEEALAEAAQSEPQPEIRLYGDRKTDYEHVVRVMAAAQRAGIAKLAFVTKPRD